MVAASVLSLLSCYRGPARAAREQEGAKWPAGLKRLVFGANFKQKVEAAGWPDSLEEMTFSTYFNQPIEGTKKW